MNDLISFLKSKVFWKHLLYALGGAFIFFNLILLFIKIYTHHGQALSVPDFRGLSLTEASQMADDKNLRLQVIDSVFTQGQPGGTVVSQVPSVNSKVKQNRIIFITINAINPEKMEVPNVVGVSIRQAEATIVSRGFKLGITQYIPDPAVNYVLRQLYRGREINPGTKIIKGSKIDLVVGMGLSSDNIPVPNLVGLSLDNARETLSQSILNFGGIIYDNSVETVEDTTNAVIWMQKPDASSGNRINLGGSVSVWLTVDQSKVSKKDTTKTQ